MSNHKLIIMRHAKSDWTTDAQNDFDRPLSRRGKEDAPRIGEWLAHNEYTPGIFLSSPALRARQTSLQVAEKIGFCERDISLDKRIYGASLLDLLTVVEESIPMADCIMLVGHNPGLDTLLTYMSNDPLKFTGSGKLMTTAAVAVLDYGKGPVSTAEGSGSLEAFIRPKELGQD